MPWIYVSLFILSYIGVKLKNKVNILNCTTSIIFGSFLFFLISNFGVWFIGGYEKSLAGLLICYFNALPFFQNTLLSSIFYGGIMFGGYESIKYFIKNEMTDTI